MSIKFLWPKDFNSDWVMVSTDQMESKRHDGNLKARDSHPQNKIFTLANTNLGQRVALSKGKQAAKNSKTSFAICHCPRYYSKFR